MSGKHKITLPKLGESIVSATIVQWFKKVGEIVQLDEPLLEVSTDKVNSEIPSPVSGILEEILAYPDQELQVGDLLAVIKTHQENGTEFLTQESVIVERREHADISTEMKDFFSPALLRLAREQGIEMNELDAIPTTGSGGRLTKRDLEIYLEKRSSALKPCSLQKTVVADIERVKMSGMRKAIADNMVRSFYEAPHASLVTEVDVTDAMKLIQEKRKIFLPNITLN